MLLTEAQKEFRVKQSAFLLNITQKSLLFVFQMSSFKAGLNTVTGVELICHSRFASVSRTTFLIRPDFAVESV